MSQSLDVIEMGETENPQQVIVLLHGLGDNGESYRDMGGQMAEEFPDALILLPSGPLPMEFSEEEATAIKAEYPDVDLDNARSWFDINLVKLPLRMIFNRMPIIGELNKMIDSYLDKHDLADDNLALFGFSQGGALSLYAGLKRDRPCAAVVCHSAPFPGFTKAKSTPPTLMITGDGDIESVNKLRDDAKGASFFKAQMLKYTFNFFSHDKSVARLEERDVPVESAIVRDLGHSTSKASIDTAIDFIKRGFAARKPSLS